MIRKFVQHDIPPFEDFADNHIFIIHARLVDGKKLTRDQKAQLFSAMSQSSYGKSTYCRGGWMAVFDGMPGIHRYWVKFDHGHIEEYWAPDKTSIRKDYYIGNQVDEIVEVA